MSRLKMLGVVFAVATSLSFTASARAELVFEGFRDLGGTGFGNAPRLITIDQSNTPGEGPNTFEQGGLVWNGTSATATGDVVGPCCTSNQNSTPTLSTLGWSTGANVGIGFNTNQTGKTEGLTLENITLKIYEGATLLFTAQLAGGPSANLFFSNAVLDQQQGNGNSVFSFILNAGEQADFNAIIAGKTLSNLVAVITNFFVDKTVDDGAESLLGFNASSAVPLPPALLLFGGALVGMGLLNRRRRKEQPAQA